MCPYGQRISFDKQIDIRNVFIEFIFRNLVSFKTNWFDLNDSWSTRNQLFIFLRPGGSNASAASRYTECIRKWVSDKRESLIALSRIEHLNGHSLRKGSATYATTSSFAEELATVFRFDGDDRTEDEGEYDYYEYYSESSDGDYPGPLDGGYSGPLDGFDVEDFEYGTSSSSSQRNRYYRQRALAALEMEVVEEDTFETHLRRIDPNKISNGGEANSASSFFGRRFGLHEKNSAKDNINDDDPIEPMSRSEAKEAIRIAQQLHIMGISLSGGGGSGGSGGGRWGGGRGDTPGEWEPYFPELLELTWPPEGRLIERDCTCDLWNQIRCEFRKEGKREREMFLFNFFWCQLYFVFLFFVFFISNVSSHTYYFFQTDIKSCSSYFKNTIFVICSTLTVVLRLYTNA